MAFVLNDRVKETTTTTGTGTINLGGAATGFETFVAGIGNSNVTYYCIAGQGTAEFEVGIGTVTDASPDTLSRTTILSSSNSDSAVDFSAGTKDVFCTLPASKTIRELDTALNVPTGTTAQRASSPAAGDLRFNTTSSKFEGYSGSAWGNVGEGNFLVTNIFAGDGSDTTFTISNAVSGEQQLMVFIDGVFQAHDSYSVSGTTVTFSTAPANGRVITIYSALNNVQGSNMVLATMTGDNSDTTLALGVTPTSENAVQVYFDGTYQNKDTYSISGQTLTFSTAPPTGVAVEAITHTITDISAAASNILVDEFTGDGSDTTFTLSAAPTNENNTQVFVGGVYQEKATYSISNAVLTFTAAPANGVSIEVVSIAVGQINSAVQLADADGDTKVMVEESSDEDTIRMDIAGTEVLTLTNSAMTLKGTTPTLTIGDAGAEDTKIVFDGNAQDFYIGLDDSADDLLIGLGSTVGTTPAITIDENLKATLSGDVEIGTTAPKINLKNTDTSIVADQSLGVIEIESTDGSTGSAGTIAKLDIAASGVFDGSGHGSDFRFSVGATNQSGSIALTEAMRINSTGNVKLGDGLAEAITYTTDNKLIMQHGHAFGNIGIILSCGAYTGGYDLMRFLNGNGQVGDIRVSGSATDFDTSSDYRLKENVTYDWDATTRLKQLKPARFNWIADETNTLVDGFLAHEVSDIVPNAINGEKDAVYTAQDEANGLGKEGEPNMQGIDHSKLVPLLVKTIQELEARIETLEGS